MTKLIYCIGVLLLASCANGGGDIESIAKKAKAGDLTAQSNIINTLAKDKESASRAFVKCCVRHSLS